MNRFICNHTVVTLLMCISLVACSNNTIKEYHETSRNNVIDIASLIVSIEDNLPPINSFAVPIIAGDTLILLDYRSTDFLFTAYDIYNDSVIGRFGKYGTGPGEAGNPLFRFYNKYNKNLYIGNANRGKLTSYHLPESVSDSTYNAIERMPMDFFKGILSPYVIDESIVICTTYSDLTARDSRLSTLNLDTGEISVIDSMAPRMTAAIAVSEKDNLIYSADIKHDLIRLFDLDGKLYGVVYGPEYDENSDENDYYFSTSEICGNQVASIYTGRNSEKRRSRIIMTDLKGRYIKTLRFDETIHGMQYHDKTGRLYLTTTGEPQIGYIELDKIPD